MDFGEQIGKHLTLEERHDAAYRQMCKVQNEIDRITAGNLTPEEALRLGTSYISCEMELWLNAQDMASHKHELGVSGRDKLIELYRGLRIKAELALVPTEKGDYSGVKSYLLEIGENFNLVSAGEFGEKFKIIADKMPGSGAPFKSPPPAWQDPEFQEGPLD